MLGNPAGLDPWRLRQQRRRRSLKTKLPALARWGEWINHQYDPGYWTRGRIPPFFAGRRPNRLGYALLATGVMSLLILAFPAVSLLDSSLAGRRLGMEYSAAVLASLVFAFVFAVLQVSAGIALLRKR
jgi:hypothetical protein